MKNIFEEKLISKIESDLDSKMIKIQQRLYDNKNITLTTTNMIYLFSGLIFAGLSTSSLEPLHLTDLNSSSMDEQSDGAIIMKQIKAFLDCKNFTRMNKEMILNLLSSIFTRKDLWRPINGESILKALYKDVQTDIIPLLESPVHIDFMGRIFNRICNWNSIENDLENDVVLTPRYITELMAKLCRINKNSFVWDRTMGSAGFLITAMELMIKDAKNTIDEVDELADKIESIKKKQLFGIEALPEVFILAIINMILMGSGSSNMVIGDGHDKAIGKNFPANVFLFNPPYSAEGKGFIFVEEALSMMDNGYAAILIQESAGSGQGLPYTKEILKRNTLVASIHMPDKLFVGKAGVQTAIYVFEVNKPHQPQHLVKFIDFSNDGYFRQSKKKSNQNVNLRNIDDAIGRYAEVEAIILDKKPKTNYYTKEKGSYVEDTITLNGNDWTYAQHRKINIEFTEDDFRKTMQDFMSWKINKTIHENNIKSISKSIPRVKEFRLDDVFEKIKTTTLPYKVTELPKCKNDIYNLPALTAGIENQGLSCFVPRKNATILKNCISVSANGANTGVMFYQPDEFTVLQDSYALKYKGIEQIGEKEYLYLISVIQKQIKGNYDWSNKAGWEKIKSIKIKLPVKVDETLDFEYMRLYMSILKQESINTIKEMIQQERNKIL